MIVIDRNPEFDKLIEQVRSVLRQDEDVEPSLKEINSVIGDLHYHYGLRSNIVDMEPLISELHKPFYEAFNNLLLRFGFEELQVINFTISDPYGTFILVTQ